MHGFISYWFSCMPNAWPSAHGISWTWYHPVNKAQSIDLAQRKLVHWTEDCLTKEDTRINDEHSSYKLKNQPWSMDSTNVKQSKNKKKRKIDVCFSSFLFTVFLVRFIFENRKKYIYVCIHVSKQKNKTKFIKLLKAKNIFLDSIVSQNMFLFFTLFINKYITSN